MVLPALTSWPLRGWLGLVLVGVFWALNWSLDGLRTHWGFFPLWLGYCLVVDALVEKRRGHSQWTRSRRTFVGWFLVSIPAWWLFEWLNRRTGNWVYLGREHFSSLEYAVLASLSFSTVMPAVFGTAEYLKTCFPVDRIAAGPRLEPSRKVLAGLFLAGWGMLLAVLLWPKYCFPLVWGAVYAVIEPVNVLLGNPSLFDSLKRRDWRPAWSLAIGALVCGVFWELWNVHSYPKWIYHVPYVGFAKVFEMPLLGYGGYLPFGLELYALYNLGAGLFRRASENPA